MPIGHAAIIRIVAHGCPHLGRQQYAVTQSTLRNGLPQEHLALAARVGVGSTEQVYPRVETQIEHPLGIVTVCGRESAWALASPERERTKCESRHDET